MKATVDIPSDELRDAMRFTKSKTKREAIRLEPELANAVLCRRVRHGPQQRKAAPLAVDRVLPSGERDGCGRQSRVDDHRFITVEITVSNSHHVASLRVEVVGVFTHCSAGRPLRSLDVASRVVAAVSADATPRHREPLARLCQHSAAVTPAP